MQGKWRRGEELLTQGFQRQYLPCLSISYVAIDKDLDKLPPKLYQTKMKICYDQPGCNDIGVVIATKRHHYLFYLQPSNQYSSRELSPPWLPRCSGGLSKMYESDLKIFWVEVFVVGYSVVSIRANVIFRKRSEFEIQFYPIVLSFTFKRVSRDQGNSFSRS